MAESRGDHAHGTIDDADDHLGNIRPQLTGSVLLNLIHRGPVDGRLNHFFLFNLTVEFVDPLLDRGFRLLLIERTADADDD